MIDSKSCDLEFYIYPFAKNQTAIVCVPPPFNKDPIYGFDFGTDDLYQQVYVSDAKKASCESTIYKPQKAFCNDFKGTFLTNTNHNPVFSKSDTIDQLKLLHNQGVIEFSITFVPECPILKA